VTGTRAVTCGATTALAPPGATARKTAPSVAGTSAKNAPSAAGTTPTPVSCQVVPSSERSSATRAVPTGARPVSRTAWPASTAPAGASSVTGATVTAPAMKAWMVQR
jgi:hypothetical protein